MSTTIDPTGPDADAQPFDLDPNLNASHLALMFDYVARQFPFDLEIASTFLQHPAATPHLEFLVAAYAEEDQTDVWDFLAARPLARTDSTLRHEVLTYAGRDGITALAPHCDKADWQLIMLRALPPDLLHPAISVLWSTIPVAGPATSSGGADPAHRRVESQRVFTAKLKLPTYVRDLWRDSVIRAKLVEFGLIPALVDMLNELEPEDLGPAFRRLAEVAPSRAVKALMTRPTVARGLTRVDLVPLLESSDASVREVAFAALKYLP